MPTLPSLKYAQDSLWSLLDSHYEQLQWLLILISFIIATVIRQAIVVFYRKHDTKIFKRAKPYLLKLKGVRLFFIITAIVLWIMVGVRSSMQEPYSILNASALLLSAYCLYNITSKISEGRTMPKLIGFIMLCVFVLQTFGWLDPLKETLTSIVIPLGDIKINVWKVITALISLFALLWVVGIANNFISSSVRDNRSLPPSIRVLIGKAARLLLYVSAFLISLKIAGVDLGALAFFSGALGLGIGFGLQKVISNLVSGVIILLDKSIKPGDVIEIDGTYGWINNLQTRYVSVLTRDRKEILIPNEDFVTNPVINWSFSDRNVRLRASIGISYNSDLELAMRLCEEATLKVKRVLANPAPLCLIEAFGNSSIDLRINFWINDAPEGVSNVTSDVYLECWKSFKEHNIEIPFPQQDLHIKSIEQQVPANILATLDPKSVPPEAS